DQIMSWFVFLSSRRRHTRFSRDWSSDVCSSDLLDACIRFLGRTPAPLVIVPLEDVMAEMEQPNLPGAPDSHPNWRRRWPLPASRMLEQPGARQRLKNL